MYKSKSHTTFRYISKTNDAHEIIYNYIY